MEFVLAILVLVAAVLVLAYPLYSARPQALPLNASTLDDLLAHRDGVYATLRDLDMDRQLGKLDAADYHALREKYMTRAAEILEQLDALRGESISLSNASVQEASAEIERQVAALRRRTSNDKERIEPQNRSASVSHRSSLLRCTSCGRPYSAGDQYCAQCGHALR
jgi:hypothetical protein